MGSSAIVWGFLHFAILYAILQDASKAKLVTRFTNYAGVSGF
jgi:hypothetical protein